MNEDKRTEREKDLEVFIEKMAEICHYLQDENYQYAKIIDMLEEKCEQYLQTIEMLQERNRKLIVFEPPVKRGW